MSAAVLKRAGAVTILAGVILIIVVVIVGPFLTTVISNRAAIVSIRQRIEEVAGLRIDPASLAMRRASLEAKPHSGAGLLKVDNESEVPERLNAYLRTVLQVRDPDFQPVRSVSPATDEEGTRVVRANITLQIPQDSLLKILTSLETGEPTLFVEAIRLRQSDGRKGIRRSGYLDLTGTVRVYLDLSK